MPWTSAWGYTNLLSVHCIQGFSEISFSLIWFGSFYHTWCEIFSFYFKLHRCFHVLSPLNLELSKWKLDPNQKVVLHERKRHTARHVASTTPAVLLSYPILGGGGVPHLWPGGCTWSWGTPCPDLAWGYLVLGYPPSGTGIPSLGKGPMTSHWGIPQKDMGPVEVLWGTPRKDMGPVEVLWDGVDRHTCENSTFPILQMRAVIKTEQIN